MQAHALDGLTLLLGGAVDGSSLSSRSNSIKNLVGRSFRFLLSTVAVSRDKRTFNCKSQYSPKHVAPADDSSLTASNFLGWDV